MVAADVWELLTSFSTHNTVDDNVVTWTTSYSVPDEALHSVPNTSVCFTSLTLHHIRRNGSEFSDTALLL